MNYKKAYAILVSESSNIIDILEEIEPKTFEIYRAIDKLKRTILEVEEMFLALDE